MSGHSKELIAKTIQVWQPYSLSPITIEDAGQIISSMVGLAKLLDELKEKYHGEKESSATAIRSPR